MNSKYKKKLNNLGEQLYTLREAHGMSQEELAEKLNVSRQTISNWENDKAKLDVEKAAEICRLFDVSMDELFLSKHVENRTQSQALAKGKLTIMIITFVFALCLIVIGMIFLLTSSNNETSSTIYLGTSALWGTLIFVGIAMCIVLLCFIFKKK